MTFLRILSPLAAGALVAALCSLSSPSSFETSNSPERERGLQLTLTDSSGGVDVTTARFVALRIPEGKPLSPFLAAGTFRAQWTGSIDLEIRSRVSFSFRGHGTARLFVDENEVLSATGTDLSSTPPIEVRLKKGPNAIRVAYESPTSGDAWVRLYWSGREFGAEPVPPHVFSRPADPKPYEPFSKLREGRRLVASARCVRCHALPEAAVGQRMPELESDAPSLHGVGSRLTDAWLLEWLKDPRALRSSARMPDLLHGAASTREAADLTAWLSTLREEVGEDSPKTAGDTTEGGHLFQELGCIACHRLEEATAADDRISLRHVNEKYRPQALARFLESPSRHYAWTRMPDFGLTASEAAALAAFLRSRSVETSPEAMPGDANRGRELARELRCLQCHEGPDDARNTLVLSPFARWSELAATSGCLAPATSDTRRPDYGFSEVDRAAILALARHGPGSLSRDTAAEFAERQITELSCNACHVYDEFPDLWEERSLEVAAWKRPHDEKEVAQWRPILTWMGDKLTASWMRRVFRGEIHPRLRPWLYARMPAFRSRADLLAIGLPERHGLPPEPLEHLGTPDPELVQAGAFLIDSSGFGCTACHALAGKPPYATFEFKAVDFQFVHERLRSDYYYRWMRDSRRIDKSSRMPTYQDDEGRTEQEEVLEGDAQRQYEAMLHFLQTLRK